MSLQNPSDDYYFPGKVQFKQAVKFPADSVPDSAILGPLLSNNLQHTYSHHTDETGTVVAATKYLCLVAGATGTVKKIKAAITEAIATGADRTVTIDLAKSTGGGAFASILGSTIVFDHTSALLTAVDGAITSAGLVVGDILRLTVAVAGSASAQALGLAVTVVVDEDAP